MNTEEQRNDGADHDRKGEDQDHGRRDHHPEPKPEPPGRVIHPRPSHGDGGAR